MVFLGILWGSSVGQQCGAAVWGRNWSRLASTPLWSSFVT
jgi:hypothetical protein